MKTEQNFKRLFGSSVALQTSIAKALQTYQLERDMNTDLLTEIGKQRQQKEAAAKAERNISRARNDFKEASKEELTALKNAWKGYLTAQPRQLFIEHLRTYKEFGIQPTRTEIEALLAESLGNSLAARALNNVLETTGSPYRIGLPDISQFEKDLQVIGGKIDSAFGVPLEFTGSYREITNEPTVRTITQSQDFTAWLEGLQSMEKRWTAISTSTIEEAGKDPQTTGTETAETAADTTLPIEEQREDVALAERLAAQANAQADTAQSAVDHYTGKA